MLHRVGSKPGPLEFQPRSSLTRRYGDGSWPQLRPPQKIPAPRIQKAAKWRAVAATNGDCVAETVIYEIHDQQLFVDVVKVGGRGQATLYTSEATQSSVGRRSRLVSVRRRLSASRRSRAAREGRDARRSGGSGASACRSAAASRTRAASRLRS